MRICWVIHSDLGGSLPVALIDSAIPGALRLHELPRDSLGHHSFTKRAVTFCVGSAKNLVLGLQKAVTKLNLAPDL